MISKLHWSPTSIFGHPCFSHTYIALLFVVGIASTIRHCRSNVCRIEFWGRVYLGLVKNPRGTLTLKCYYILLNKYGILFLEKESDI